MAQLGSGSSKRTHVVLILGFAVSMRSDSLNTTAASRSCSKMCEPRTKYSTTPTIPDCGRGDAR